LPLLALTFIPPLDWNIFSKHLLKLSVRLRSL
jgi:hypothetical protein